MPLPRKKIARVSAALAALLGAGVVIYLELGGHFELRRRQSYWYYDLNTGHAFAKSPMLRPPIEAPSGPGADGQPAGVKAYVWSCASCGGAEENPAWLETFTPEFNSAHPGKDYNVMGEVDENELHGGRLVKKPGDDDWADAYSDEGMAIQTPTTCPDDTQPKPCDPGS